MKLNNIIAIVTFVGLILSGCSGFLDTVPHDSLNSDNAIESIDDFNNTTNSVYESIRSTSYTSEFNLMVPDIMSDNLILHRGGRLIYNQFADFKFYADTYGVTGLWSAAYNGILGANEVITRLEVEIPFTEESELILAKNLLAESLALRGMIHFDLVRWYGRSYKTASATDLGVTYKKDTKTDFPARNTVKEVYTWLVEDLEQAKTLMADSYNAKINYRLNKKSINAILARVYLTMGENQKAVDCATAAIAGDGTDMADTEGFSKVYTTSMAVPEVLFRIAIKSDDKILAGNSWGQGATTDYNANYSLTHSLKQLYTSTDCRSSVIKLVTSKSGDCYVVWKWNNGGASVGLVDIPVIRAAEMYLTRAEAYYNLSNQEKALADLNVVRSKRYSDYAAGTETGQPLEVAIQLQRRLELAFEGHRFFDLKRRGEDVIRDDKGFLSDGSGTPASTLQVVATSPYYLLPIPQSEIEANENMVQNNY
ncbi:RagB/SusD family nutrient uptake outer membrane protein [Bacteroides sp. 214]|uniref:RagB/SusD family nutrient uptake outer membrane protein n=1 Tax=Bacteroides sp. 214 TaxID=2302935 RepID=UPI0013D2FB9E|nr:RagB/SusD family nutrient uptake outer membrane protein [Bacteroides sp. 214]NDW13849.1 RagB/SusD family nutrient uptake outer membrane protein [Bacteroides sp. 214]